MTCSRLGNSYTLFIVFSVCPVVLDRLICLPSCWLVVVGRSGMHHSLESGSHHPQRMGSPVLVMVIVLPLNILTSCGVKMAMYFALANFLMLNNELCCNPGTRWTVHAGSCTSWCSFAACIDFTVCSNGVWKIFVDLCPV